MNDFKNIRVKARKCGWFEFYHTGTALPCPLVMIPKWDLSEEEESDIDAKKKPLGKMEKIRCALSRYQREEALSNPCRSMPVWQDALVAGAVYNADVFALDSEARLR